MPPKAATDKAEKMFSADVVAAVLFSTGTTSLSKKHYELMSSLDGKKSACGFQHDFRSVLAKAKELRARVESGEEFKGVPASAKRGSTTPSSAVKKRVGTMAGEESEESPCKRVRVKKEVERAEGKAEASEGVPEDVETFIKNEDSWEEKWA